MILLLLLLDTTDDFKFQKFRIVKNSATCPRNYERIALFLVCLSTSPERPVRGDVAEEDNDPDHAAQFCVNMRSISVVQSSVWRRFLDEVYPIHAQSIHQLEPGNHAPTTWISYFAQFRLTTSTIKKVWVMTRLSKPVTRSKTLAIHMRLSEEDLQWTLTPHFSRVCALCFRKFAGSPQE